MIMITGATGNIGRELVRELDDAGVPHRILVRDPSRAACLPERAQRVVGDLSKPKTLTTAFEGIDKLFLLTQGIEIDSASCAVAAARAAGVRHIVFVSSCTVQIDPLPAMARWHFERERIVRSSGIPATILRPGGFMTNALDWLPSIREGGYVLDPISPGRYAPVDPADIAAVAAVALTTEGHEGKEYALTGHASFTVPEQVRIVSETIGRTIELREPRTLEEAVRFRFPNGAPPRLAEALGEAIELMRADTTGFRTDTVEQLLKRPPGTFADWCVRNADAFRLAYAEFENKLEST